MPLENERVNVDRFSLFEVLVEYVEGINDHLQNALVKFRANHIGNVIRAYLGNLLDYLEGMVYLLFDARRGNTRKLLDKPRSIDHFRHC